MTSTDNSQPFPSFHVDPNIPPSRQLNASIWAPQPERSDTTWPMAIDAFSRVIPKRDPENDNRPDFYRATSFPVTREDVFGPVGLQDGFAHKNVVGAIGDGRRNKSDFDDHNVRHLCNLTRSLC